MTQALDKSSETPLYLQLSDCIIEKIQKGEILVDRMIPSERALMSQYDVSRATVRQALDRLAQMGYLRKQHGKGSFITLPGVRSNLGSFADFAQEMQAVGKSGTTEVLFFRIILCGPELAGILRLASGKDYVFKLIRLNLADGEPMLLETTYLPYWAFEGLNKEDIQKAPLNEIITVWYRKPVTRSEESYEIASLTGEEAATLRAAAGDPAMLKKRLSFSGEQVIEYTQSLSPQNRLVFRVVIQKGKDEKHPKS